jgi:hypothetical protein
MAKNPNLIQNGGFEQGTPSSPPTSWSGNGSTETGGHQLLGSNNALLTATQTIFQTIPSVIAGEIYTFQAGFHVTDPTGSGGTILVDVSGNPLRSFPINNIVSDRYSMYNFDFVPSSTSVTIRITFQPLDDSDQTQLRIDVVSAKLS